MEFSINALDIWHFTIYIVTTVLVYCVISFVFWRWKGREIDKREIEIINGNYERKEFKSLKEVAISQSERFNRLIIENENWIKKGKLYDKEMDLNEYCQQKYREQVTEIFILENKIGYLENQLEKQSRLRG